MKILLVTSTLLMGGTERYILNFVKNFKENEIDIAFFRWSDDVMTNTITPYIGDIYHLPYYVSHPIRFVNFMKKFYREHNYDIVYCHANHGSTIFYTFPIWKRKNVLIMYHSHNSHGNRKLLQFLCRIIINKVCMKRFACSKEASIYMYDSDQATIINNSIDIDEYRYQYDIREEIRAIYELDGHYVIGHVGQFSERKNHKFIIKIFESVLKKIPNAILMLVGTGELMEDIQKSVTELRIDQNILFIGNSAEVNKLYQAFDLFLLPSLYEGLPFAGIEAQASGTCCLLSDVISKDIKITPLVHFMSLERSPEEWAEYIAHLSISFPNKKDYSEMLESAGFGLNNMKSMYKDIF